MPRQSDLRYTFEPLRGDPFEVVSFTLEEGLSQPFKLELELVSHHPAIDFYRMLDLAAVFTIWRDDTSVRYIHGLVSLFQQGDTGFRCTRYTAVVEPTLKRFDLRSNWRIFQGQTVPDIITSMLAEQKLTDLRSEICFEHQPREYCVQAGETDLDFIARLAAEEGLPYTFEHRADGNTLVHTDCPVIYQPMGGGDSMRYDRSGRLIQHVDALGQSVEFGYDAYGRLLHLSNENRERYCFEWDALDRLLAQQDLDGSGRIYQYDPLGEVTGIRHIPAPLAEPELDGKDTAESLTPLQHHFERDCDRGLAAETFYLARVRSPISLDDLHIPMPAVVTLQPRFPFGGLAISRCVDAPIRQDLLDPLPYVRRHIYGDWGDVRAEHRRYNNATLELGGYLLSSYAISDGLDLCIFTEADRSLTAVFLLDGYRPTAIKPACA